MSKTYRKFIVGSVLLLALSGAAPASAGEPETVLAPFGNAVVSGSAGITGL